MNFFFVLLFLDQRATNYFNPLQNVWKKVGLDANYLKDEVPLEIEKTLARIKVNYGIDIFFSTGVYDDPRNTSSYSLLYIGEIEEPNKYKKR